MAHTQTLAQGLRLTNALGVERNAGDPAAQLAIEEVSATVADE